MAKTSLEHLLEAAKKQNLKSLVVEQLKEARFSLEQVENRTQKKKSGWQNIVPETDKWQQLTERTRYLQTDTWEKFTIEEKNGRFWHSGSIHKISPLGREAFRDIKNTRKRWIRRSGCESVE